MDYELAPCYGVGKIRPRGQAPAVRGKEKKTMKMPMVSLFAKNDQDEFRRQYPYSYAGNLGYIFSHLRHASDLFRSTRMMYAEMVGPNFEKLVKELVRVEVATGETIDHVQMAGEDLEDEFCKRNADMQGCAISVEGFKEYMGRVISPRKQAWGKVVGMWVVPPKLTLEEVELIEDTAKSIYTQLTAPESTQAPSVPQSPPSHAGI